MNRFCIKCPTCGHPIEAGLYNLGNDAIACQVCNSKLTLHALPALYRQDKYSGEALMARLDDAVCFYHEGKKAEQVCDDCGRFLCGLCVLPIGEETLCSACIEKRRKQEGMHALKPREMRYDKFAAALAFISVILIFFWGFSLVPALASIFIAFRFWTRKPALARGFKVRMVSAILISVLSSVGSVLFVIFMIRSMASV